ncbi:MAG: glycosyltransferase, partial [Balneolaceae bacterium]
MKIVDVAEFYTDQGGGVKTYINGKLRAGAEHGHEVVIVAPGPESKIENRNGGKIIWVKSPPLIFDKRYYIFLSKNEIHRILDRERPDIVEGSSPWTGGYFAGSWQGDAIKTFIFHVDAVAVYPHTILGNFLSFDKIDSLFGFYWYYLKKLSNKYDATIVSGNWLGDRLDKFNLKNTISVPFGIDKKFFSPERRDLELRRRYLRELNLDDNAKLFICVSRYHPEKRLSTIIDGFTRVKEKHKAGLMIFGDGPFRKWVEKKANGVEHLKLMGFTSNRDELADAM